jgi:hypothetical protein
MKCGVPLLLLGLGYSISFGQSVRPYAPPHGDLLQFGIVDCFGQGKVHSSRIKGAVFDPTGVPVPGAKVLLTPANTYLQPNVKPAFESETDKAGWFVIKAAPGDYILDIETPAFVSPQVEIDLGSDFVGLVHPDNLYAMPGLSGSFCPWVTTSQRKFDREVRLNKRRLQTNSQAMRLRREGPL